MFALGVRHSSVRPARSVLSLALIAFASFVLVSVGAFKKDVAATANALTSGTGGFSLMAESVAPLMHDPNAADGRDALGFESGDPTRLAGHRHALSTASGRRDQLPDALSADQSAHHRAGTAILRAPALLVRLVDGANRRGTRQPLAAAEPHLRRWRDRDDRGSNDADVRAAPRHRRRLQLHAGGASRPSGCALSARWPTASCNRS